MKTPRTASLFFAQRGLSRAMTAAATALLAAACSPDEPLSPASTPTLLTGFASLPAATFADGLNSGNHLGAGPINGQTVPFPGQPVEGFSAVLANKDGSFLAMPDNGYGKLENSADFHLRVYTLKPDFKTAQGGSGEIRIDGPFIELRDPDRLIPFAITNHFTDDRILTGADFDIESMQRAGDGSFWFGDEFGPFLLHADASGKLLDPPIPLPDVDTAGAEIRSPQNPFNEEGSTVRIMNALRAHAAKNGNKRTPVFSPWSVMINDGDENTNVENRKDPPAGSGVTKASSELFDVTSLHSAGYSVVTWTVNTSAEMTALLKLGIDKPGAVKPGVDGIISDRPDLLYKAVAEFDLNGDGKAGDLLDADGLIDASRFDAQSHRGGRNLRPENTLPAFEVGLDNLMTTLELDIGLTSDSVPVISHDPHVQAQKCRRTDMAPYTQADEVLIKDVKLADLQSIYICDLLFRGPDQVNTSDLSPVVVLFKTEQGLALPNIYAVPTLEQLFAFVGRYIDYYKSGPGMIKPEATRRWKNAERVRYNIETKVNPRAEFAPRTIDPGPFAEVVASTIKKHGLTERADIQSFDFRTLLYVQEKHPEIRTVYLFGDFPLFADRTLPDSDDGTNLQNEADKPTPWLAGISWPYRKTQLTAPFRAQTSGGFEAMALTPDGKKLLAVIERPLTGDDEKTVRIHEFDIGSKQFTGVRYAYKLDVGVGVADFIMTDATHGLVIERDETQGDLKGHKVIYEIKLGAKDAPVEKKLAVDLLKIDDPSKLAGPGAEGDVGFGPTFAFPFQTIEAVVQLDKRHIGVMNDNNYPFGLGRHLGTKLTDDNEFILIDIGHDLNAW
jgi:glycerophosphoryl diester phosphodiesterase